ncbi:MAG: recombination protein RecR [Desulfuromonadaceae bacterium]|nr:recombination protein RecR [Desulfuromonadaceae bacterium]
MLDSVPSFDRLIAELAKFPGIGRKTATRLAFFVLKQPREQAEALADALKSLKERVCFCSICFQMTEQDPCRFCLDPRRDSNLLCIVEEPQDVMAIERSHCYQGRYHVLHGALSPLDGIGPESLKIPELKNRLSDGSVKEVIIATNFNVKGETTALYLARFIHPMNIRVTRLAHGIPLGSDLEYIDEATVGRAVKARQEF